MVCAWISPIPTHMDTEMGERLECVGELGNSQDVYAVAMTKKDVVAGHNISTPCSVFLRKGDSIQHYCNCNTLLFTRFATGWHGNLLLIVFQWGRKGCKKSSSLIITLQENNMNSSLNNKQRLFV